MGISVPLTTKPMEAEPVDDLPRGKGWLYEPKYDGFRCLAFRVRDRVDLQSKKQKSLNRFFPEVAVGLAKLKAERFVNSADDSRSRSGCPCCENRAVARCQVGAGRGGNCNTDHQKETTQTSVNSVAAERMDGGVHLT